jgi:hypothetical protein
MMLALAYGQLAGCGQREIAERCGADHRETSRIMPRLWLAASSL